MRFILNKKVFYGQTYVSIKVLIYFAVSSREFDLHLMLCFLKNTIDYSISNDFNPLDISKSSDLSRIWYCRTQMAMNVNGKLSKADFKYYWVLIIEVSRSKVLFIKTYIFGCFIWITSLMYIATVHTGLQTYTKKQRFGTTYYKLSVD